MHVAAGGEAVRDRPAGLGETRGAALLPPADGKPPETENLGTVIAFSAEPGKPALDGDPTGNSPYAAAVLRHLSAMDGAEFGLVMRMIAEEVYLKTGGRQRPWMNESLRRLLYFGRAPPSRAASKATCWANGAGCWSASTGWTVSAATRSSASPTRPGSS